MPPGGGLVLLALLAAARAGAAPGSPDPIRVELDAPAGCPDTDAFYASLLARAGHVRRAEGTEDAVRLIVRLTRAGAGFHGELRLVDPRGATDLRKVDGATCDEVAEALSLTAALALGPSAHAPARAAVGSAAPGDTASPGTPTGPGPGPVAPEAPAPAAAAPAAPPPPESASREASAPVERNHPDKASPREAVVASAPRRSRATHGFGLDVAAQAMAANIVSPDLNLGGAFEVAVARRTVDTVEPAVGLALLVLPDDFLKSPGAVAVHLTAAALTICPGLGLRAAVTVQLCAQGIGGRLTATERDVTNPLSASRLWWSAGGLVRAAAALGAGFALRLDAGASAALVRRRFVTTTPEETVGQSPRISIIVGFGVAYEL